MHDNRKEWKLGERKVATMNFSKVVTLPKMFTDNYLDADRTVTITLTQDGRLILTPKRQNESGKQQRS
jgi:virulence-associated protein VagC